MALYLLLVNHKVMALAGLLAFFVSAVYVYQLPVASFVADCAEEVPFSLCPPLSLNGGDAAVPCMRASSWSLISAASGKVETVDCDDSWLPS